MYPMLKAPQRAGILFPQEAHTELRRQCNRSRRVGFLSGNLVLNSRTETKGMSARVCQNGLCGFSSTAELTEEAAARLVRKAGENARFLASHLSPEPSPRLALQDGFVSTVFSPKEVEQTRFMEFVRSLDDRIARRCPKLLSRQVVAMEDSMEKSLSVSDGTDTHSLLPRAYVMALFTVADQSGAPVELYRSLGGMGLFGDHFDDPAALDDEIDSLYERLLRKAEGIYPKAGMQTCVLDASLAGMLAHEAVGHTVEADMVMSGSVALHCRGSVVASPLISLTDFAHSAFGQQTPLPVYIDDEGVPAVDAPIIDKGVLTGYMHNRESAMHFDDAPTGNARAYLFSDEPLIRMRNTAILPGESKLADMIASVEDGYYFTETNNGQADMTGEFMFGITEGYEIKNGRLGRPLRDTTISGVAFDMLKTVDMVSDEMKWVSAGVCGKKQPMPVGMGGPALRCRVNVGGR